MTREFVAVETADAPPQPRLYYGWLILVVGIAALICSAPGQTFGIAMFYTSLREDLGLSNTWLTGTYMLATLLAAAPMTHLGILMDRWGMRKTLTCVVILLALACASMACVQNTYMLFIAFFLLRLFGQGAIILLSGAMLAFWFERKLGRVEGIRFLGLAFAIAVVPDACLWLINEVGWRTTYIVLGCSVLAIMLPLMVVYRNRPEDVGQYVDGDPAPHHAKEGDKTTKTIPVNEARSITTVDFTLNQALRTSAFWILLVASGYWAMAGTAVIFSIQPIFKSHNLSAGDITLFFKAAPIALVSMQLIGGWLADYVRMHYLLAGSIALFAASIDVMLYMQGPIAVALCGALMGMSQGIMATTATPLVPRYFGRKNYGRIRGFWTSVVVACSSVGPLVLGVCMDLTGSFDISLILLVAMAIPISLFCLRATRPVHPDLAAKAEADSAAA